MMDINDLTALKTITDSNHGMSDYEEAMLAYKQSKRANGATVAAITIGSVGLAAAIGAWIFGPVYAAGRSRANEALIMSNAQHAREMETLLAGNIGAERAERISFNNTQNPSLKDYITVTQSGNQTASATSSAFAQAEATLLTQSLLGNLNQCPQKVSLYSAPQPCACPASGCSCGCQG